MCFTVLHVLHFKYLTNLKLQKVIIPYLSHDQEQFYKERFQDVEADLALEASGSWILLF
jgi:hypothetical protein